MIKVHIHLLIFVHGHGWGCELQKLNSELSNGFLYSIFIGYALHFSANESTVIYQSVCILFSSAMMHIHVSGDGDMVQTDILIISFS